MLQIARYPKRPMWAPTLRRSNQYVHMELCAVTIFRRERLRMRTFGSHL